MPPGVHLFASALLFSLVRARKEKDELLQCHIPCDQRILRPRVSSHILPGGLVVLQRYVCVRQTVIAFQNSHLL